MTMFQKYMRVFILSFAYAAAMALPYIHFKFYDTIKMVTQTSNTELGTLMTIYTLMAMLLYIPGGIIADKFSSKMLLQISLTLTALCNVVFALCPSYTSAVIIWGILAITTGGVFWPCLVKAVRDSGDANEQGRMFGTFYGAQGLVMVCIGFIDAAVYANFVDNFDGFRYMLFTQAGFLLFSCLLIFVFLHDKTDYNVVAESKEEGSLFGNLIEVLKIPGVWILSVLIFCGYGLYVGMGYMTPYTTNVLGASVTMGAILGTLRVYGIRIFTGPLSGYIADKLGSSSKLMIIGFIALAGMLITLLSLPVGVSSNTIIALTMLTSFCCMLLYCVMFASMGELKIPVEYSATTISVLSLLGFIPDGIFPPLFGYWLDAYGSKTGYVVIFTFLTCLAVIGLIMAIIINRISKAKSAEAQA